MSNIRKGNGRGASTGLFLIIIGAALLVKNMNLYFLPDWIFSWPMIIIVIGLYSGIRCGFRNNSWIIMMAIGGFFLANEEFPGIINEAFFWPAIIIALGFLFLLRPERKQWKQRSLTEEKKNESGFTVVPDEGSPIVEEGDNYLHISSIFSGVERVVLSKNFQGGDITCIFGGGEVDLQQADINGRVTIRIDEVFGGLKFKVPAHWVIENRISGVFHGVDDKRNRQSQATVDPTKILVLQGSCVFGGIEIKSY